VAVFLVAVFLVAVFLVADILVADILVADILAADILVVIQAQVFPEEDTRAVTSRARLLLVAASPVNRINLILRTRMGFIQCRHGTVVISLISHELQP